MALFMPLFATGGIGAFDFWWWMSANAALLTGLVVVLDSSWREAVRKDLRDGILFKIGLGLASAALLYAVFFVGNLLARWMFAFAAPGIDAVYGLKDGSSLLRVGLLIGLLIGPAEEWFWRGFLQRRLALRHGPWAGLAIATVLYTGMHVTSLNPMLVLAAGICGLFWGLIYMRYRSLLMVTLSHLVWDLAVFVFFPYS
jgi:membrane protease YdiL (CAAX protease family)